MHPKISSQISLLRIGLICGLVFLHYGSFPGTTFSHFDSFQGSPFPIASFINCGIVFFLFSAVPLLSVISGYLFFRSSGGSIDFFVEQLRKRFSSVLLPMFIWNNMWLVLPFFLVLIGRSNDWTAEFGDSFTNYHLLDYLNNTIGIKKYPIAFQFWYVRDLILCFLLSPLVFLGVRLIPIIFFAILGVLWLTNSTLGIFFRIDILLFFAIGSLLTRIPQEKLIANLEAKRTLLVLIGYISLVAIRLILPSFIDPELRFGSSILDLSTKVMRLSGVVTFWMLAAYLVEIERVRTLAARYSNYAFFLFAAHWPTVSFIKGFTFRLYPVSNNFVFILNLLIVPTVTIFGTLAVAVSLDKYAPRILRLLNGNRVKRIA